MDCTDQHEPIEIGAAKWDWLAVPLATFALGGQLADAAAVFCGNITVAIGAHLNYKREVMSEVVSDDGPIMTE